MQISETRFFHLYGTNSQLTKSILYAKQCYSFVRWSFAEELLLSIKFISWNICSMAWDAQSFRDNIKQHTIKIYQNKIPFSSLVIADLILFVCV